MNMNQLLVFKNKYFFIVIIILSLILFFSCLNSKIYASLFYVNSETNKLIYENRAIIKYGNKIEQYENVINELLLGPVNPNFKNQFDVNSKLLGVFVEKSDVFLNFNRETFDESLDTGLIINSIVNTLVFFDRSIKRVYFQVDGVSYSYIGKYGPIDNGVILDNDNLSK